MDELGVEGRLLVRGQCHHPVLVGEAEPAPRRVELDAAVILDVLVAVLLQRAVEDPIVPFVQDEEAQRLRRAETQDPAIGRHRHGLAGRVRSEEHTSELQSLMRISYAVFCLKKQNTNSLRTSKS